MKLMRFIFPVICFLLICSLTACTQLPAWKGKIIYNYGEEIKQYEFATKNDKTLFKKASQPFLTSSNEIYFVNEAFPKRNLMIRKSNAGHTQFRDVLDMSSDNVQYKEQLEAYSVIRGTGISGILERVSDPRLSPDGRFLSVTIFGYPGQAFSRNCVAIFDINTQQVVRKFEDMYYASWLADGRILAAGSHKTVSTDRNEYHSETPGIFIADPGSGGITRIDPQLDDPAPYHPALSPDGKRVAFILNNHVWVMGIDGSNLVQLTDTDNDNIETFPAWSPDGKYVAAWTYKTFERSYFTALAIVPSRAGKPIALTDKAAVWPRDKKKFRISGGSMQINWK